MRAITIDVTVPRKASHEVFATLADFARYPELSPAVRSVHVDVVDERTTVSRWEVSFRAGILRWVERDVLDPVAGTIEFQQLEGDVAEFSGSWSCHDRGDDVAVTFAAQLDLGIPSLADALEPIAVRTLRDNTIAIVQGLFGPDVRVDGVLDGHAEVALAGAAGARS